MEHRKEGEEFKSSTVEYGTHSPEHSTNHYTPAEEPKQPGKMKRHCQKWWWAHLLQFSIVTLIISLLLTYVALTPIAQGEINKAVMTITEQIVADPKPDMITLHVVSQIETHSIFKPDIESFNVSLFLEDTMPDIKPFGMITIPQVHADPIIKQTVTQQVRILDQEQFNKYNLLVTQAKSFRLALRGKTRIHLGALPVSPVNFNKVVDVVGLNGFEGIEVSDIKITLLPDADGNNMNGTIMIPNPTVMTITVGDMVQDIYAGGKIIGNTTINNMILRPGRNFFPMVSAADQVSVITLLTADKRKSGILAVEAKARTVKYKGLNLPYFEYAMSRTPVKINLNLKEPLKAIGLDLFAEDTPATPPKAV